MMPNLQEKLDRWKRKDHPVHSLEKLLTHDLQEALVRFCDYPSSRALRKSDLYQGLHTKIDHVTNDIEYGFYHEDPLEKPKDFYRAVFWNLSGQVAYESLSAIIARHPLLHKADIFYFAHADIGRERSGHRNLVRTLALEKSYNYVSSCSWVHLSPDLNVDKKPMPLQLEGLAIMTKYPLSNFRLIPMAPTHDPMRGRHKKIGCEKALVADVTLCDQKLTAMALQLDEYASPRQRAVQLETALGALQEEEQKRPLLLGGDLQSTGYNTRGHLAFLLNTLNKIFRGIDYIAKEHHLNPHLFFDKPLFQVLANHGLHVQDLNEMNKLSTQKRIEDFLKDKGLSTRLMTRLLQGLKKLFFHTSDRLAFRPDWFAGNAPVRPAQAVSAEKPRVVENYSLDDSQILTHTPLVLDFVIEGPAL